MTDRLIVFDVDGTLIDSAAHILASMEGAFAAVGRAMPPRAVALSVVGLSLPLALGALIAERAAAAVDEVDEMVEAYKRTFQSIRVAGEASPLYPGTREMLDRLAAEPGVLLGIATGKSRRGLDHLLDAHGLAGLFATCQVADDHPSKPHPAMLNAALAETGIAPARAAMVGDTEYDMEMGRAAGVRTVAVRWGFHGDDRLGAADRVIESWDDLPAALAAPGVGA